MPIYDAIEPVIDSLSHNAGGLTKQAVRAPITMLSEMIAIYERYLLPLRQQVCHVGHRQVAVDRRPGDPMPLHLIDQRSAL